MFVGLAHGGGEVVIEDTDSVDQCVLYTQRADIRSTFLAHKQNVGVVRGSNTYFNWSNENQFITFI